MATVAECKGCRATVRLRPGEVERIVGEYLREHGGERADERLYRERLAACRACTDLEYGTTCRHCGCLVELRARLAGKHCPRPGATAW
jgi:hypothetical protein